MRDEDDPLPDYAWASAEPADVGVTRGDWELGLPPIVAGPQDPDLPDAPLQELGDLTEVTHPRIRVMGAYWHEGWPYAVAGAWLRPEALERIVLAVESLPWPFGLAVWDAWRDPRLQAALHDRVYRDRSLPPGFVAAPDPDPRRCPPHASGGTVDLTLTWRGHALSLGTRFDAFIPGAAADALEPDGQQPARQLRRLLASAMQGAGFVQHPQEWWHWEFGTRYWAAVTGQPVLFGRAFLS